MPSYIVPPLSKRLPLPCGEWLDVKLRLNHGEYQDVQERCYLVKDDGSLQRVPFKWTEAMMIAYLVDWSFVGLDDQPIAIRGRPADEIASALRGFEQDIYHEIRDAIDAHVAEQDAAREAKKKAPTGEPVLSTI